MPANQKDSALQSGGASFCRRWVLDAKYLIKEVCVRVNAEAMKYDYRADCAAHRAVSIFCEPAFIVRAFFVTLLGSAAAFTLPALAQTYNLLIFSILAFKPQAVESQETKGGLAIGRPVFG